MPTVLWVVVGIVGYLALAFLGLLLCRGIALADRIQKDSRPGLPPVANVPRQRLAVLSGETPRAFR
jgi:hypothetical protein